MRNKTALIHSNEFIRYNYGEGHPFKPQRYLLAYELMCAYGLNDLPGADLRDCPPVGEEALLTYHTPEYLEKLKEFSAASAATPSRSFCQDYRRTRLSTPDASGCHALGTGR